jgi:cytosine/creatinine deaminase
VTLPMVLANATLADGHRADMEIADQRITAIRPADSLLRDTQQLDLGGALLLPGLIDGHLHLDKNCSACPSSRIVPVGA